MFFDGKDIRSLNDGALTSLRAHDVGFVFQQFNLIPTLTAAENIAVATVTSGLSREQQKARALELLGEVGLAERAEHLPTLMSGGEQQRVAMGRALANHPRVILADEPTGNLDSKTAREIIDLLANLCERQGVTVILITHDEEVASRAQRKLHMRDGLLQDS
jgi:putative ABC transport system ATP-binding protein